MSHYLETDYFYCNHISESDLIDIKNFIVLKSKALLYKAAELFLIQVNLLFRNIRL